ncbi:MAG TPA: DUF429 domain-containing protein [Ktedonobacteraceae bacterium]|nr:DUF429 domain-containing protein [Ktedonobacteraceae bacterium]
MRIYGLDFTSIPSRRKPITSAACELHDDLLRVEGFLSLTGFEDFESFLHTDGPWLAGLDFPFGQPRKLIENLGWPQNWVDYMQIIASMERKQFEALLTRYQEGRPAGDKQHLRSVDILAHARSPMMMYRVPVGKMFFEGATRLLKSEVSILPCRPTNDNRIVFEGYPALVARKLIGKRSYKSDERRQQTRDRELARKEIIDGLHSDKILKQYGLRIGLAGAMVEMLIKDAMGDTLDALLCAVQAGWAFLQRDRAYGIPRNCDVIEGWIIDPVI